MIDRDVRNATDRNIEYVRTEIAAARLAGSELMAMFWWGQHDALQRLRRTVIGESLVDFPYPD